MQRRYDPYPEEANVAELGQDPTTYDDWVIIAREGTNRPAVVPDNRVDGAKDLKDLVLSNHLDGGIVEDLAGLPEISGGKEP